MFGVLTPACTDLAVLPRHPFIEDRALALDAETLTITVHPAAIDVDALFVFRPIGPARDRVMTFPIAAPRGPAEAFTVTLEGPLPPVTLPAQPAAPGALPAGLASQTWDVVVPGPALAAHGGVLRVRYRQPGAGPFAYTLLTGAYWDGPIRTLDVVVADPESRVARFELEGAVYPPRAPETRVRLVDVEPRGGLRLSLR